MARGRTPHLPRGGWRVGPLGVLLVLGLLGAGAHAIPVLDISDDVVIEGDAPPQGLVQLTISRFPANGIVSVDYATVAGTATAGIDFVPLAPTTVTLADGEATRTIQLNVIPDHLVELEEAFYVVLSSPVGAAIQRGQGTVTIVDDDTASVSILDASVIEGDAHPAGATTAPLAFAVRVDLPVDRPFTVDFSTTNGTIGTGRNAMAASTQPYGASDDYLAVSGTLCFDGTANQVRTVVVMVNLDRFEELDEVLHCDLSAASADGRAVRIVDARADGTIYDDDQDADRDGVPDAVDSARYNGSAWDTDGDGVADGVEVAMGTNPNNGTSPANLTDTDHDGIPDDWESANLPADAVGSVDVDGDRILDSYELAYYGSLDHQVFLGDIDGVGGVTASDVWALINAIYSPSSPPWLPRALDYDINCDGQVDYSDYSLLMMWTNEHPSVPYLPYSYVYYRVYPPNPNQLIGGGGSGGGAGGGDGDADTDGIDDTIDGTWTEADGFTDQSDQFSRHFTDRGLGGSTSGEVVPEGGAQAEVRDLPAPHGVHVRVQGQGSARFEVDERPWRVVLGAGGAANLSVGSLEVEVITGPVTVLLDDGTTLLVPEGGTLTLREVSGGGITASNHASSPGPAVVDDGVTQSNLAPGETVALDGTPIQLPAVDTGSLLVLALGLALLAAARLPRPSRCRR